MADKGIPGLPDHVFMAFPHNSAERLTSHTLLLLAREGAEVRTLLASVGAQCLASPG